MGFEPIELKSEYQIANIIYYIQNLGVQLKGEVIPLGYDYGCLKGQCKTLFQSLTNENTLDFTWKLKSLLDKDNLANKDFS